MGEQNKVHIGFSPTYPDHYEHDRNQPTLVFFSNGDGFAALMKWLEVFKLEGREVRLSDYTLFIRGKYNIVVRLLPRATGMKQIDASTLEWNLSNEHVEAFIELLEPLSQQSSDDKETYWQYLDISGDEVDVVAQVGVGEYPPEAFL